MILFTSQKKLEKFEISKKYIFILFIFNKIIVFSEFRFFDFLKNDKVSYYTSRKIRI